MSAEDHPVIRILRRTNRVSPKNIDFLIENGKPYKGRYLTEAAKKWPLGQCMSAANHMESRGFGRYIYGLALMDGSRLPMLHAWNSPNGIHAIDATWNPLICEYWGLARRFEQRVANMVTLRGTTTDGIPLSLIPGNIAARLF